MPAAGEGKIQKLLPRDVLERLYVVGRRSAASIAAEVGTHKQTVHKLVKDYGLVKRSAGPGVAARLDPDELYRMHNVERLSMEEIGQRLGVAPGTAWGWMRRFGVPRRALTLRQAAAHPEPAPWVSQKALVTMWEEGWDGQRIAEATGLEREVVRRRLDAAGVLGGAQIADYQLGGAPSDPLSRELLEKLYLGERKSPWEIALQTNTTPAKVNYRLKRFGIPRWAPGERKLLDDITPELLRYLYVEQHRSSLDIAALLHCSSKHVNAQLHKHGIQVRAGAVRTSGGRTPLTAEVLIELHVRQGLSPEQIAVKLGYLRPTGEPSIVRIRTALHRHAINIPHELREIADTELARLYTEERLDEAEIGERLGWRTPHGKPSVVDIRIRLVRAGIDRWRKDGTPNPDSTEILRLHQQEGLTPGRMPTRRPGRGGRLFAEHRQLQHDHRGVGVQHPWVDLFEDLRELLAVGAWNDR